MRLTSLCLTIACFSALVRTVMAQAPTVPASSAKALADLAETDASPNRLIDLTHPFDAETIYWPTAEGFSLITENYGRTSRGYFYAAKRFSAAEHGGTHLDAPVHFSEDGQAVEQLPLDRFIGEAAVIDVTESCSRDADYLVGIEDLRSWERMHNRQLVDVIVLIRTGFGQFWPNRRQYLGTDRRGTEAVEELHFPGLSPEAAKWMAEHRAVKAVGIDTASIDHGQSATYQSHVVLFEQQIPVFENVAGLHLMPPQGATVVALPMKIASGTGAPLRIIAFVPKP